METSMYYKYMFVRASDTHLYALLIYSHVQRNMDYLPKQRIRKLK